MEDVFLFSTLKAKEYIELIASKNITNCAFGGKKLRVICHICNKRYENKRIKKYKFSGCLFKIQTNAIGINQKILYAYDKRDSTMKEHLQNS